MEPIFVETTLDVRDWEALQRYIRGRFFGRAGRNTRFLAGLVAGLATAEAPVLSPAVLEIGVVWSHPL